MAQQIIHQTQSIFEQIKNKDDQGNEYWSARDLANTLEYSEYRHFKPVIEKAKEACTNSAQQASDHFEDFLDMIATGKGARREIDNVKLSRYACYLIIQNSSPDKEIVALAQTYFAVQTRLQEIQQSNAYKQLNTAAKIAGVITAIDYAVFQNHGYMGSTELAANLFRATQTEEKLTRENVKGKQKANKTHFEVGKKVRKEGHPHQEQPSFPISHSRVPISQCLRKPSSH